MLLNAAIAKWVELCMPCYSSCMAKASTKPTISFLKRNIQRMLPLVIFESYFLPTRLCIHILLHNEVRMVGRVDDLFTCCFCWL